MAAATRDLVRARDAFRGGDLDLAARLLKRILSAQPAHGAANELMGYVEAQRGDRVRALAMEPGLFEGDHVTYGRRIHGGHRTMKSEGGWRCC